MNTGVSIVIPTWNGLDLLKRFLPSVIAAASHYRKTTGAPAEIVIVDDAGTDSTAAWLNDQGFQETAAESAAIGAASRIGRAPSVSTIQAAPAGRLIRNETNSGFGVSCNRGVAAAEHPLVFLLNNDVEVSIDSIAPLVENFADETVFAAHCRVFELEGGRECGTGKVGGFSRGFIRVHQSYRPMQATAGAPLHSMFAGGGSAMFDREKFLDIGGFERLLSPFYWEDVELSYRAWKRGFVILYEPRSIARHRVSSTIGKIKRGRVRRIEQRNRLFFHWINLHDARLVRSHIRWAIALAVTAVFRLKPGFLLSCLAAIKLLPRVRKRRAEERLAAVRSDRQVFEVFSALKRRSDLSVFDD